jgi:N-acetylneuraminic acid mutarotase
MRNKRAAQSAPARHSCLFRRSGCERWIGKGGSSNRRVLIAIVLCIAAACSVVSGTLLAFFGAEAPSKLSQRSLTFAERVAYQRAIEEVYWRHRIWPKERPDPKPSLDAVMSQAQLEKKVEDYLRNSQALEDYWQRPLTAGQLQAEMDRMANHTKQPEVLSELFEALGDNPFIIAECLARPILSQRLKLATVEWRKGPLHSWRAGAENQMPKVTAPASANYTLPVIASPSNSWSPSVACTDDTWTPTSTTVAPTARILHTAVWTGSEMIVWGGYDGGYSNTGGRYNPSTDSWTATSTTNAPAGRQEHAAVWTGSEMIVWGGLGGAYIYLNTGGRYNPSTDTWTATSTTNAPSGRQGPTAVWTGSQMIVWGGFNPTGGYFNTGGRYNPSTNSWIATSTTGAPDGRQLHTAVWSGSEMIVWGGRNGFDLNTGGRYNPSTDSWIATSTISAPEWRHSHTAVWAGTKMIVWGGNNGSYLNTGGRYDPSTDSWTATSTSGAPDARDQHTAVWTGSEMIVWGGYNGGSSGLNTGGRYSSSTDSWTPTNTSNAPAGRYVDTAVWTGSQMIVWGGYDGFSGYLRTGGRYCAVAPGPQVVLYDQYNNAGTDATVSATFTDSPPHNSDLADDFVVPGGQTWHVQEIVAEGVYFNGTGPAIDWNVFFYTNNAGFPGTQIYSAAHQPAAQSGTMFMVNLPAPAVLNAGTYWVEIQANMNFSTLGEWGWTDRMVTSNHGAVWRNPGGGFGICQSWSRRGATCNIDPSEADQVYALIGTMGATPTPTATASPTPTATFTPTPTPTPTASPTPTPTPTPCTGRCSPTARPAPTSAGRPTPPPRLTPPPTPTGSPRPTPAPRP